jgi:hypothetical protein
MLRITYCQEFPEICANFELKRKKMYHALDHKGSYINKLCNMSENFEFLWSKDNLNISATYSNQFSNSSLSSAHLKNKIGI